MSVKDGQTVSAPNVNPTAPQGKSFWYWEINNEKAVFPIDNINTDVNVDAFFDYGNTEMVSQKANTLICTLGGTKYYTTTDDAIVCAYGQLNVNGTTFSLPIVASKTASAAKTKVGLNGTPYGHDGSTVYNGETWYYAGSNYAQPGTITNTKTELGNLVLLNSHAAFPSDTSAIVEMLDRFYGVYQEA